jgi:hypothetical protein
VPGPAADDDDDDDEEAWGTWKNRDERSDIPAPAPPAAGVPRPVARGGTVIKQESAEEEKESILPVADVTAESPWQRRKRRQQEQQEQAEAALRAAVQKINEHEPSSSRSILGGDAAAAASSSAAASAAAPAMPAGPTDRARGRGPPTNAEGGTEGSIRKVVLRHFLTPPAAQEVRASFCSSRRSGR